MTICIYCGCDKPENELTLEHVIPQSLGGAYAPEVFKCRNVCKQCNSNLGLFVDASFEKHWVVSNTLQLSAIASFDFANPIGLPLICMGNSDLNVPGIGADEICETWLGPLGEQIYWIRPKDENLYWYVGGNPRSTKDTETRAYFMFSERSEKNPLMTWLSFKDAFDGKKKVKKIMCTNIQGDDPQRIGFRTPDALDEQRIDFFKSLTTKTNDMRISLSFFLDFDNRFAAKLALGIGYCLFGQKILTSSYTQELRKGLWHRPGESPPEIRGTSIYHEERDPTFVHRIGYDNAVTLIIAPSGQSIALNLNIGTAMGFSVMCADTQDIDRFDIEKIQEGLVIVLFKYFRKGFSLSLHDYVAHKLKNAQHAGLAEVDNHIKRNIQFLRGL